MLTLAELLLIVVVLFIIFGASRLPEIGTQLGKGIFNLKRAVKGNAAIDVTPAKEKPAASPDRPRP